LNTIALIIKLCAMPRKQEPQFTLDPVPMDASVGAWYTSGNAGALKELVNSEVFRKAEALLKENSRPTRGTLRNTEANSLSHAAFAGYCDAFHDLRKLCSAPAKINQSFSTSEWDHLQ